MNSITLRGPSLLTVERRNEPHDDGRALTSVDVRDAFIGTAGPTYPTLVFSTLEARYFVQMTPGVAAELAEALQRIAREHIDTAAPRPDGFAPGFDFAAPTCPASWKKISDFLANRDNLTCPHGHSYGRPAVAPNGSLRIPLHNDTPKEQTS